MYYYVSNPYSFVNPVPAFSRCFVWLWYVRDVQCNVPDYGWNFGKQNLKVADNPCIPFVFLCYGFDSLHREAQALGSIWQKICHMQLCKPSATLTPPWHPELVCWAQEMNKANLEESAGQVQYYHLSSAKVNLPPAQLPVEI